MKENNRQPYSEITSFEDFRFEKERLLMNKKLMEVKIKLSLLYIRKAFSFSNLIFSFLKK